MKKGKAKNTEVQMYKDTLFQSNIVHRWKTQTKQNMETEYKHSIAPSYISGIVYNINVEFLRSTERYGRLLNYPSCYNAIKTLPVILATASRKQIGRRFRCYFGN